jgi:hypothetical protein
MAGRATATTLVSRVAMKTTRLMPATRSQRFLSDMLLQ